MSIKFSNAALSGCKTGRFFMPHAPITLSLAVIPLMTGCSLLAPTPEPAPPQTHYHAPVVEAVSGTAVSIPQLAERLAGQDVVMIGEYHGHQGAHLLQSRLQAHLYQHRPEQVLSMEQFEVDRQPVLDRYLAGDIGEMELVEDAGLLTEVAGLVEWPVPLLGEMDPDFLDLPPEVITLTMKTHQKYFAVKKPGEPGVTSKFVCIANQVAPDGGVAIAAGNARVLSARLSDARHFWDNDRKTPLSQMAAQLSKVTFHEKLGTVADKVERVAALARELAPVVGADPDLAENAARLAKADLVSEMVYEFPELQGAMGRYYALDQGEDAAVADAIKDHYKPQGPSDAVPTAPVSAAVALADKLDTLVGFWAIDEKPTGSKDPFALRRAALGVIRVLLETGERLPLSSVLLKAFDKIVRQAWGSASVYWVSDPFSHEFDGKSADAVEILDFAGISEADGKRPGQIVVTACENVWQGVFRADATAEFDAAIKVRLSAPSNLEADLLAFFADRLKVHLRDEGIRHDVIDAVFALGDDDLVRVTAKARALQSFLDTDDGAALLAGFNRAANILKAEEKKSGESFAGDPDADYLSGAPEADEQTLIDALTQADPVVESALEKEDFTAAMAALAGMRAPIDAFFENVTVNTDDERLRRNRLLLLSRIRTAVCAVADFDKISG